MKKQKYTIPQMVDDVRSGKMPRRRLFKALAAMGLSTTGIAAIGATVAGHAPISRAAPHHMDLQEIPETHAQLHNQHIRHQSTGNSDALQNDYAENAVVEDSMLAYPLVGREAIMGRKKVGMAAIPDLEITITNRVVHSNQVSAEWVATGTHSEADLFGIPATGRSFTLRGVTVTIRESGKIVRESIYYDVQDLHRQIGPR